MLFSGAEETILTTRHPIQRNPITRPGGTDIGPDGNDFPSALMPENAGEGCDVLTSHHVLVAVTNPSRPHFDQHFAFPRFTQIKGLYPDWATNSVKGHRTDFHTEISNTISRD
jgi:hypothetical protein|tara:strand:- start:778 stop:1116 length:339 start_codon:yes stop_codon:yes gene_type:complete